jgi:hypothetical protein
MKASTLAAIIFVTGVLVAGLVGWFWLRDHRNFSPDAWKAEGSRSCYERDRGRMIDDLVEHHLPVGLTGPEVALLLGEPDQRYHTPPGNAPGLFWQYGIGPSGVDCGVLRLQFLNGRLARTSTGHF